MGCCSHPLRRVCERSISLSFWFCSCFKASSRSRASLSARSAASARSQHQRKCNYHHHCQDPPHHALLPLCFKKIAPASEQSRRWGYTAGNLQGFLAQLRWGFGADPPRCHIKYRFGPMQAHLGHAVHSAGIGHQDAGGELQGCYPAAGGIPPPGWCLHWCCPLRITKPPCGMALCSRASSSALMKFTVVSYSSK